MHPTSKVNRQALRYLQRFNSPEDITGHINMNSHSRQKRRHCTRYHDRLPCNILRHQTYSDLLQKGHRNRPNNHQHSRISRTRSRRRPHRRRSPNQYIQLRRGRQNRSTTNRRRTRASRLTHTRPLSRLYATQDNRRLPSNRQRNRNAYLRETMSTGRLRMRHRRRRQTNRNHRHRQRNNR